MSATFSEEAEAFERAARFLERQGTPATSTEADPAYRRGVVNGVQLAVMQLEERARAMREMAAKVAAPLTDRDAGDENDQAAA